MFSSSCRYGEGIAPADSFPRAETDHSGEGTQGKHTRNGRRHMSDNSLISVSSKCTKKPASFTLNLPTSNPLSFLNRMI